MDQVIPNLWIGNLPSALNTYLLRENKIRSVLSVMRGRVSIHDTFLKRQIPLDDDEEADILIHLIPSISFIEAELEKGRGVLVHCQGGISRSATIVAAFLMYTRNINCEAALKMIREVRPNVQPNDGFMTQLEIFHQASFKVSPQDKATRMFYLKKTLNEVKNGDGSPLETSMFADFPKSAIISIPATTDSPHRRIRCKKCRQELATREHMLDHGQVGPPTPRQSPSPSTSRRSSSSHKQRPELTMTALTPSNDAGSGSRRGSMLSGASGILSLSAPGSAEVAIAESDEEKKIPVSAGSEEARSRRGSSALLDVENEMLLGRELSNSMDAPPPTSSTNQDQDSTISQMRSNGEIISTPMPEHSGSTFILASPTAKTDEATQVQMQTSQSSYVSPADLAARVTGNPKLAALRQSILKTPIQTNMESPVVPPPLLINQKCSGYFLEPISWMEPFLQSGQLAGKIICPNPKCGVKLGNYDWAGVCCSCKEWVTPGFCIARSKVDEVV